MTTKCLINCRRIMELEFVSSFFPYSLHFVANKSCAPFKWLVSSSLLMVARPSERTSMFALVEWEGLARRLLERYYELLCGLPAFYNRVSAKWVLRFSSSFIFRLNMKNNNNCRLFGGYTVGLLHDWSASSDTFSYCCCIFKKKNE